MTDKRQMKTCVCQVCSSPATIEDFADRVKRKGKQGLYNEYAHIQTNNVKYGTFINSMLERNTTKNRYRDVLCYDQTRVVLSVDKTGDRSLDYINANYVDGYKQKKAFIATQGPLPKTCSDFWRMIWEQQVVVITMTTLCTENGRRKCNQYWPLRAEEVVKCGHFEVSNLITERGKDYTITMLQLRNLKTGETRSVAHMQFTSWPDFGVPLSATAMVKFIQRMRYMQRTLVKALGDTWTGHPLGPPIVAHCSAGIGRTGSLCTIDICLRRLEDVGMIGVAETVKKIRSQRYGSIQTPDQYLFCHTAILEYAADAGLIHPPRRIF